MTNLNSAVYLYSQPSFTAVTVSGEDAHSFLNNITTRAVPALDPKQAMQAQLNGWCNNKGRLISLCYLLTAQTHYYLLIPQDLEQRLLGLLRLYRLRAQVVIEQPTHTRIAVLAGLIQDSGALTTRLKQTPPGVQWADIGRHFPRALLIGEGDDDHVFQPIVEQIDGCQIVDTQDYWDYATIADRQPWLNAVSSEQHLAQSMNLDGPPWSVCSLDKGCYPGQEIIARMHYLGKRKRGLHSGIADQPMSISQGFYRASGQQDNVGRVLQVAPLPDDPKRWAVLAELALATDAEPQTLYDENDHLVCLTPCPVTDD